MAIDGLKFNQQYPFLGISGQGTSPARNYQPVNQGVPNTPARVMGGFSAEDYEKVTEQINRYTANGENPFSLQGVDYQPNTKGVAWNGFKTPEFNGTGDLIPDVSNREDSIEGCRWDAYLA